MPTDRQRRLRRKPGGGMFSFQLPQFQSINQIWRYLGIAVGLAKPRPCIGITERKYEENGYAIYCEHRTDEYGMKHFVGQYRIPLDNLEAPREYQNDDGSYSLPPSIADVDSNPTRTNR